MKSMVPRLALVWAAILVLSTIAILLQSVRGAAPDPEGMSDATPVAPEAAGGIALEMELAGKFLVAVRSLSPATPSSLLLANAQPLREGGPSERLAYAMLIGRLEGWEKGLEEARAVEIDAASPRADAERALSSEVVAALELLSGSDGDSASISTELRERLESNLGFFGRIDTDVARSESTKALVVIVIAGLWYVSVFLVGLVLLAIILGGLFAGRFRPALEPATDAHTAVVLGETFAIWMALFLGLTIAAGIVAASLEEVLGEAGMLALSICAMFGSLLALLWPAQRGVSWSQTRALIGLSRGKGLASETLAGIACYLTAVPILVAGLVAYAILAAIAQALRGDQPPPSHPAVEMLASAGPTGMVLLYLLASVTAPIVEEIAFRGVLLGHMRGVVAPQNRLASFFVAAVVSSTIFAAIHPQGLMFVPALGGLAVGFCLFREARGSLVAPMVAHGINNAVTLTLGITLLS